jgi:hypothetical protein
MQLRLYLLVLVPAAEVHYIMRFYKDPSTNRARLQDMQGNKVQLKQQPVVIGSLTIVPVDKVLMSGKHHHGKHKLSCAVLGAYIEATACATCDSALKQPSPASLKCSQQVAAAVRRQAALWSASNSRYGVA